MAYVSKPQFLRLDIIGCAGFNLTTLSLYALVEIFRKLKDKRTCLVFVSQETYHMLRKAADSLTSSIDARLPVLPFLAPCAFQLYNFPWETSTTASVKLRNGQRNKRCLKSVPQNYQDNHVHCPVRRGTRSRTKASRYCDFTQLTYTSGEGVGDEFALNDKRMKGCKSTYLHHSTASSAFSLKRLYRQPTPWLNRKTRSLDISQSSRKNNTTLATANSSGPSSNNTQENIHRSKALHGNHEGETRALENKEEGQSGQFHDTKRVSQLKAFLDCEGTPNFAAIPGAIPYDYNPSISEQDWASARRSVYIMGEVLPKKKGHGEVNPILGLKPRADRHRGLAWPRVFDKLAHGSSIDERTEGLYFGTMPITWQQAVRVLVARKDWRYPDYRKENKVHHHPSVNEWIADLMKYGQSIDNIRQACSEWSVIERQKKLKFVILKVMDETPDAILWILRATNMKPALNRFLVRGCLQVFAEHHLEEEPKFVKEANFQAIDEILDTIDALGISASLLSQKTLYLLSSRGNKEQLLRLHGLIKRLNLACKGHTLLFLAFGTSLHGMPVEAVKTVIKACEAGIGRAADSLQSVCCAILRHARERNDKYKDIAARLSEMLSYGIPVGLYFFNAIVKTVATKGDLRYALTLVEKFRRRRRMRPLQVAYTALLRGCETSRDSEAVNDVLEMVVDSDLAMSYEHVATQLIYVSYLYHSQQRDRHLFDTLLRVYRRFYSLGSLIDLGLVKRHEELSEEAEHMKMLPGGFTTAKMIIAWLHSQPPDAMKEIEAVYSNFRRLVERGDHVVGRLTEHDHIYRAFLSAFGKQPNGLEKCADIVRDMDRPLPQQAYWHALGRPLVQKEPTRHVWEILADIFFRKGEEKAALLILGEMRRRGLQPTISSYNKFLKGYAYLQDLQGISSIFTQIQRDGLKLNDASLESLAKIRNQARLGQMLDEMEYDSSVQPETGDDASENLRYTDVQDEASQTAKLKTPYDTSAYQQPASKSQNEDWLSLRESTFSSPGSRVEKPIKPRNISKSRSSPSSPQRKSESALPAKRSESYCRQMMQLLEVKGPSKHETDRLKVVEPMLDVARVEILPSEDDKVTDTEAELEANTNAEAEADADAIAIAKVQAAADADADADAKAAADAEAAADAVAEANDADITDSAGTRVHSSDDQYQLDGARLSGRPTKLNITLAINDRSNSGSKDQSAMRNSSGVSILEDAAILTPLQAKWRGYVPLFSDTNDLEISSDDDVHYYATKDMEENSIVFDDVFSEEVMPGRDVIHKNLRYIFESAYKRFCNADGDMFSPWLTESTAPNKSKGRKMSTLRARRQDPKIRKYSIERKPQSKRQLQRELNDEQGLDFKFVTFVYSVTGKTTEEDPMMPLGPKAVRRVYVSSDPDLAEPAESAKLAEPTVSAKAAVSAEPPKPPGPAQVRFVDSIWERHENMRTRAKINRA